MENHPIVKQWLQNPKESEITTSEDIPNYWTATPRSLLSVSNIHSLGFGTGCNIYTNSILPAIAAAESEVILVTCFWARSPTLDRLNSTLIGLSAKALHTGKKIRVRICFSSLSIFQKLFHTASLEGRIYPPSQWRSKLGLPASDELQGLDLVVKSIFVRPFSVMHPKFVIIDRKWVFLPSCNVSWENWFEGCVELSGPMVRMFVELWGTFWCSGRDKALMESGMPSPGSSSVVKTTNSTYFQPTASFQSIEEVQSILLPSSHHRNPNFALLPWKPCPPPPSTPLNTFLLCAFQNAKRNIYIQTPNLTALPVLSALLAALKRGVDVSLLTSERLMIIEQLVTAGTTTSRCVKRLRKRHKKLVREWELQRTDPAELEHGLQGQPGRLDVFYYQPDPTPISDSGPEPTQSHLKLTIIDGEWTLLGSGNMDRASWYTSQELGVAFFSQDFAARARKMLDPLTGRRKRAIGG